MNGGYDARQVTRQGFAVAPVQPAQSRPAASGASARPQIIGGDVQAGVELAGPQTDPGAAAGQLGQFFERAMQPYIERKQHEKFFEGFTKAQSGIALEELSSGNTGISGIFGSTAFEQGAQFFAAQTALDGFVSDVTADMDNIKKMSPTDAAKALAQRSSALMTGDPGADAFIQQGIIERMGPTMQTVAKKRFEWQQTTMAEGQLTAHNAAADGFQRLMTESASVSDPTDEQRLAMTNATNSFLANRGKLEGQTDESYARYLYLSARQDLRAGRFYAVEAMKGMGAWETIPEEDRDKLSALYITESQKALKKGAVQFVPDLMALQTKIKTGQVPGGPMGAASELARINARIKAVSGSSEDLYDYNDFLKTGGDVVDVLVAADLRLQSRREQLQDMYTRRQWDREDRDAEEAEETAAVTAIWGMGDINKGTAEGIEGKRFDTVAMAEVRSDNFDGILRANKQSGWVSRPVANDLQSNVRAGIGHEYSPAIKQAYDQWQALYKRSPETAAAYYGNLHPAMVTFNAKLRTLTPQAAWAEAFGDPLKYEDRAIPRERQQQAGKAIDDTLNGLDKSWYEPGIDNLGPSGKAIYRRALTNRTAHLMAGDPSVSEATIVRQALRTAESDGSLERYGAFAWANRPGTAPLARMIGLQGAEMADVFTSVVTRELKRSGFQDDPRKVDTRITRTKNPHTGELTLFVEAYQPDGSGSIHAAIPLSAFRAYQQNRMDLRLIRRGMNDGPQKAKVVERVKAYRTVNPGE